MSTPRGFLLIDGLGVLFFAVLLFGAWIAYTTNRPASRRPTGAMWKSETIPVPAPADPGSPFPLWRSLVAFAGGSLLAAGSLMPSSLLVQSAAISSAPLGNAIYIGFAILAVLLAASRRFRFLYLAGGIPLVLLLASGVEGTILMEKFTKSAREYYGQLYGIGFSWIVMIAGAGLLVLSAAMQPAARQFPAPPPVKVRRGL